MSTLTIQIDPCTGNNLRLLSAKEGQDMADVAARLLARAVRVARPRPSFDVEALKQTYAAFAEDDLALAESGIEERAALLAEEDRA